MNELKEPRVFYIFLKATVPQTPRRPRWVPSGGGVPSRPLVEGKLFLGRESFSQVSCFFWASLEVKWKSLGHVRLFATPWTVFSRPEYWMGSLLLLQGIFPTQGSTLGLPHCRRILYQLSHKGSPRILERVPFSRGSSWLGINQLSYQGSLWLSAWNMVNMLDLLWNQASLIAQLVDS